MSSYTFESLRVWHDARRLAASIYQVTREKTFATNFGLRNQIRRAAVSVMSNIAEGYERGGRKELLRFLSIAKGSAGEVRAQLYLAEDVGHLDRDVADQLRKEAAVVSRQIAALASKVK
jgi:four helix bundle protein